MADLAPIRIAPTITGAELAELIQREAAGAGVSISAFLGPITSWPKKWLDQLRNAEQPRGHTISRIEALIRGDRVTPARRPQKKPGHMSAGLVRRDPEGTLPPIVARDPCSRCGTRADIGCRHSRPVFLEVRNG